MALSVSQDWLCLIINFPAGVITAFTPRCIAGKLYILFQQNKTILGIDFIDWIFNNKILNHVKKLKISCKSRFLSL